LIKDSEDKRNPKKDEAKNRESQAIEELTRTTAGMPMKQDILSLTEVDRQTTRVSYSIKIKYLENCP